MIRALSLALSLTCLLVSGDASAYCLMTTSSASPTPEEPCPEDGVPLAWRRRCLGMYIDDRGARDLSQDALEGAVLRSFERWTALECDGASRGFSFRVEDEPARCDDAHFDYGDSNANVLSFVSNFEELGYDDTAFAVTVVWHSTESGEIFDADMLINESFSPYAICPESGCTRRMEIDLENVITHEAGHFFGLAHSQDTLSTMYARAPRAEVTKRTLEEDDLLGFCATYPAPVGGVCNFTPHGGREPICPGMEGSGGGGCGCQTAPRRARGRWCSRSSHTVSSA